ncbi:MAG: DUF1697 domain-containing protein [Cryobacterium sp.]|nr:DUF1697 domain-containing protein [Cryobacterium sp.]
MTAHVALLRGINVGGKNLIRMPDLADAISRAGCTNVSTYIQSGNVLLTTETLSGTQLEEHLERALDERFNLPIRVVTRTRDELARIVTSAPADHGSPLLRSDVIYLKHPLTVEDALARFPEPREGVDTVTPGPGVIYFSRLDAQASKTRLTRIIGTPDYQYMTIRNWRTTTKLLELMNAGSSG